MSVNCQFASDNCGGVHETVIEAIKNANQGYVLSYGEDDLTKKVADQCAKIFQADCFVYFVCTGTAANVSALASFMQPFHAVICADSAHIHTDECGAFEHCVGGKILSVPTLDGKLTPADCEQFFHFLGVEHHIQPYVISITQATEYGTVYTVQEIKALTNFAHKHGLFVHMDGARLCNAAVSLGCSLADLTSTCGIDVLSFGGTKNGLLMGEAVIFFNKNLAKNYAFIRKQNLQLYSKMRFVAAQFEAFFKNDLWLVNATNANARAQELAAGTAKIPGISIVYPVQANEIFAKISKKHRDTLLKSYFFYTWSENENDDDCIVRWVTSFVTTQKDVSTFVETVCKTAL